MIDVGEWLKSGKYLPPVMRDFHDQKDLFKAIHQTIDVEGHNYAKSVDWVTGHCYVVDIFLWYMARRGYTLQKVRAKGDFNNLDGDVAEQTKIRQAQQVANLKAWMSEIKP
jgi:hypothetical protein